MICVPSHEPPVNPETEVNREAGLFRTMRSRVEWGRPCRGEHGKTVVERRFLSLRAGHRDATTQVLHAEESRRSVKELCTRYDERSICRWKRGEMKMKIRVVIMNETRRKHPCNVPFFGGGLCFSCSEVRYMLSCVIIQSTVTYLHFVFVLLLLFSYFTIA